MKVSIVLTAIVAYAFAEPPVDRSYLPPSTQYGAPSTSALSSQYGVPAAAALSTQYGTPGFGGASFDRTSQGAAARVSSSFGTSSPRLFGAGGRIGGAAGRGISTRYGAPSALGRTSSLSGLSPSTQYSVPSSSSHGLTTEYGVPSLDSSFGRSAALSPVYGVPGYGYGRAGAQEDPLAEPANYQFSYSVQDSGTLSDFAHDEARQDESAQGEYRVLLPDGRKQIVTYQADENGYRPTIEYVDTGITANSAGGYNYGRGGAGAENGGYHY